MSALIYSAMLKKNLYNGNTTAKNVNIRICKINFSFSFVSRPEEIRSPLSLKRHVRSCLFLSTSSLDEEEEEEERIKCFLLIGVRILNPPTLSTLLHFLRKCLRVNIIAYSNAVNNTINCNLRMRCSLIRI